MSRPPEQAPESKLESLMAERRDKASTLRTAGHHPYRNDVGPNTTIAEVRARYAPTKPPPPDPNAPKTKGGGIQPIDGAPVRVAGRVMVKRGTSKKTVFAPIRDRSGEIQLFLNDEYLAPDDF